MSRPKPYVMTDDERAEHHAAQLVYAEAIGQSDRCQRLPLNPARFHSEALQAAYEQGFNQEVA